MPLNETLAKVAHKALSENLLSPGKLIDLNEADTRALLIEPLLGVLGYSSLSQVRREFRLPTSGLPVDYLLTAGGKRIVVEAKSCSSALVPRDAAQLISYCAVEGIRWALLTNGQDWELYDIELPGDWQAKRVTQIDLLRSDLDGTLGEDIMPLTFLAWDAIQRDEHALSQWAQSMRVKRRLAESLSDPKSAVIAAIARVLSDQHMDLDPADIVGMIEGAASKKSTPKPIPPTVTTISFPSLPVPETTGTEEALTGQVSELFMEVQISVTHKLLHLAKKNRRFFPGYRVPFVLATDAGDVTTKVTSAPKGTLEGDADAGGYITAGLRIWFRKHPELKDGDKVRIEAVARPNRYKLQIVPNVS